MQCLNPSFFMLEILAQYVFFALLSCFCKHFQKRHIGKNLHIYKKAKALYDRINQGSQNI